MKYFYKNIMLIVLINVISISAQADTHYVSSNGTGTWPESTNINTPCLITIANSNAEAGDTVYIMGGTYNDRQFINPSNSGTSWSNQIVFSAYNNDSVTVINQQIPNHRHESTAWEAVNGTTVSHSTEQAWDSSYSTKFTVSDDGQGIRSSNFDLGYGGYSFSAWVYSTEPYINVYVHGGDGNEPIYNDTLTVGTNRWYYIKKFFNGKPANNSYIAFTSPEGITSGTWYIDNVRLAYYQASIFLNNDKDYIKVHGIDFKDVLRGFVIQNGSDNNEISHCTFTNMQTETYYVSCLIWDNSHVSSRYNWIHHCTFHDNGFVHKNSGSCDDRCCAFMIGNNDDGDSSRYNLIEDCIFYHNGHDNMITCTKYNTVRNNAFRNDGWMAKYYGPCQDVDGDPSTYNYPSAGFGNRNILFENPNQLGGQNLIEGNRIGYAGTPPDDDGANGIENPADANIIRYNFIYGNGASGYYSKNQSGVADSNKIYNNTFYKNGFGEDINPGYTGGAHYANNSSNQPRANVIKNNIFYRNAKNPVTATYDSVIYIRNTYANNFESDPLFIDTSLADTSSLILPDIRLQSTSQAIDSATYLTTVATADVGTETSLLVNDAGYFQDGSWAPAEKIEPDWIAVGTVSNIVRISSINYETNTITLSNAITRNDGDPVWPYRNSSGELVLYGSAPDIGAYEYVEGGGTPTKQLNLHPNYPNPFNTTTTINYSVLQTGNIKLVIYDILGSMTKTLVDEVKTAGPHTAEWDGTDEKGNKVPNGTYFYQIRGKNGEASSKKMIFLR